MESSGSYSGTPESERASVHASSPIPGRRRISVRQSSSDAAFPSVSISRNATRRISLKPNRNNGERKTLEIPPIDSAPTLKGNAIELIERWKHAGYKNRYKPEEQLHRLQVLCRYVPRAVALPIFLTGNHAAGSASSADAVRSQFFGVVLLSDISGFTQLAADLANAKQPKNPLFKEPNNFMEKQSNSMYADSMQKMGGERLATILNKVFSMFIDIILKNGGDVTKFAGDALLSVFRPSSSNAEDITKCGLSAAKAALEMQTGMKLLQKMNINLELHSGLSAGMLHELHFGGFENRWEYMFAGQPIFEMGRALEAAVRGEVVIQSSVYELIKGYCQVRQRDDDLFLLESVSTDIHTTVDSMHDLMHFLSQTKICKSVESALACYLPRSVTLAINAGKQGLIGERRQVTMVFINLPDFHYDTDQQIQANQSAFRLIQQTLHRFDGTLRQLIQDDKGTVAIAAFGLPYNSHDDDAIRAVQASLVIQSFLVEHGMRTGIGITTGGAFCGSVGDEIRCEYAIVGDIVNLSARLMVASHNGLLCDGETQRAIFFRGGHSLNISFQKMAPIKVKGRLGIVQIYHPAPEINNGEQTLESPKTLILSRTPELQLAKSMFEALHNEGQANFASDKPPIKILFIEAESGMGKTRFVQSVGEIAQEFEFTTLYFSANSISDNTDVVLWHSVLQRMLSLLCCKKLDLATSFQDLLAQASSRLDTECVETLLTIQFNKPFFEYSSTIQEACKSEEGEIVLNKEAMKHFRAFHSLYTAVIALCGPVCLIVENLRDLDVTSGIFLSRLCAHLPSNMVIFLTSKPISISNQMSVLDYQLRKLSYFHHIKLGSISRRDIEAILCLRLNLKSLPEIVLDTVHKSSEGNPELVMDLATGLSQAQIPADQFSHAAMEIVQHMLEQNITSHIDRLSPSEQEVLKCASVIGVAFSLDLLQAISPYNNERLMENLVNLECKDILVTTATLPVTKFAFRQPLMQKTVYGLLSKSDSSIYHNLIVDQLERLQQDRLLLGHLEAIPLTSAELAHHYQCAGKFSNAIKYYRLAGDAAFSLGDFNGAASYSFKALSLLEQYIPNDRFEIAKLQRSSAKYLFENHEMGRCLTLIEDSLTNIDSHVTSQSSFELLSRVRISLALSSFLSRACRSLLPEFFSRCMLLERAKALNMKSSVAIELGNGHLATKSSIQALMTSEAARSAEQRLQALTNLMMGSLTLGRLMRASTLYKGLASDAERHDVGVSMINSKPFSPFTKGYIFMKLAQVACALLADASKGRQFLKLASDKFTIANSPHHLVRTLEQLASNYLVFLNVVEVEDVLQSMDRIATFCDFGWGQRRASILRCMYHLITGNISAAGQLMLTQARPNPADDPKSALQYFVCRMVFDYYQDRPEQALAPLESVLGLIPAASYDLTNTVAWACQIAILRFKDLQTTSSDIERRQVLNLANSSLRALQGFAQRVPISRPRALLVEGMFDTFINRSHIWKATSKWIQALDLATEMGLVYDMALACKLIGTMGELSGSGLFHTGVIDEEFRARHLSKWSSLTRQYDFCLILIPLMKGSNILTDNQLQRNPSDLSASVSRDQRLQGYRQSNYRPISDIIDEGYGGESDQILLSGLDASEILVGRDHQLETLISLYNKQSEISINPVILFGSNGIGKSAIAKRFMRLITEQNPDVIAFTMYGESSYKQQIYLPVIRVLRKMLSEFGRSLGISSVSATMERVFNRLPHYILFQKAITHMIFGSDGFSDPMLNLISEFSRAQVLAIIFSEMLRIITAEFKICLLIEDLQWLDTGTWHVLSSYASCPESRIFILGTLQIDENTAEAYIEGHEEIRHFLTSSTHWIHVPPLDRSSILRLSCHLLSANKVRSGLEILLIEKSGGSPLRLTDVLLCLQEDRLLQVSPQLIADLVVEPVDALFAVSGSSVDLVKKRMSRLTKAQQNVLRLASVIGVSFPFNILRSLCNQTSDIDEFKSALTVLKNRGWLLLAHMGTSSPRISFPHASVQRDVYSTLDRESRNKFHVDLAEYYEGGSNSISYLLPLIGRHYCQTNQVLLDRKFSLLAAMHFSFLFMVNDAVELFYHCIDLDQKAPTYNHNITTAGNWLNIARLHANNHNAESAKHIINRALECIGAKNRVRTSISAAIYWLQVALMSCQSLRRQPQSNEEQITLAALYETLSYVEHRLGDLEAAHWAILQSLTIRDSSSPDISACRYCWLLKVLCDRAQLTNAGLLDLIVYRIRYWIRRADDIRTMATCYNLLGQSAGVCAYWRSSISFTSSALQLYDEILYDSMTAVVSLQRLGVVHYISGRIQPSIDVLNRALLLARPITFFHPPTIFNCKLLISLHELACSQMNPSPELVANVEDLISKKPGAGIDCTTQALYFAVEAVLKYKTGDFAAAYHAAVWLRKTITRVDLLLMIAAPVAAEILVFLLRQFRKNSGTGLEEMFGIQRKSVIAQAEGAIQLLYKASETIPFARTFFLLWHAALLSCKSSRSIDVLNMLQIAQRSAAQYAIPSVEALSHMFMAEIYEDQDQNRRHARDHARKAYRLFVESGARCHEDYIRHKFSDLQLHASPELKRAYLPGNIADIDEYRQDNESASRHANHLLNIGRSIHGRITIIRQNKTSAVIEKVMQPDDDVPDMNTFNPVPIFEEKLTKSILVTSPRISSMPSEQSDTSVLDGKPSPHSENLSHQDQFNCEEDDSALLSEWDLQCKAQKELRESKHAQISRHSQATGIFEEFRDLRSGLSSGFIHAGSSSERVDADYIATLPRPVILGALCATNVDRRDHLYGHSSLVWAVILNISIMTTTQDSHQYQLLFSTLLAFARSHQGAILELSFNRLLLIWDMTPTFTQSMICSQAVNCAFQMRKQINEHPLGELFQCKFCLSCDDCVVLDTVGPDCIRGYACVGPAVSEAFRIESVAEFGQVIVHKNLLKLLRLSGRVVVKQEFDDKRYAILQSFSSNVQVQSQPIIEHIIALGRQHHIFHEEDHLLGPKYSKHRSLGIFDPDRLIDLIVIVIRVDVPTDPICAQLLISAFAFELQTVRLSEPSCVLATMSTIGMRVMATIAFTANSATLAFLFTIRIRTRMCGEFSTECSVGIGSGLCSCKIIDPLAIPIIFGEALNSALYAVSLASNQILIDEVTQETFDDDIRTIGYNPDDHSHVLRYFFVLQSLKRQLPLHARTSILLSGRVQQRAMLQEMIIHDQNRTRHGGCLFLLSADNGVGKTSLLSQVHRVSESQIDCSRQDIALLSLFCSRKRECKPGNAIKALMRQYLSYVCTHQFGSVSALRSKLTQFTLKYKPKFMHLLADVHQIFDIGLEIPKSSPLIGRSDEEIAQILSIFIGMLTNDRKRIVMLIDNIDLIDELSIRCLDHLLGQISSLVLIATCSSRPEPFINVFKTDFEREEIHLAQMSYDDMSLLACLRLGGLNPSNLFVEFVLRAGKSSTAANLAVMCFCASRLCYASQRIAQANARNSGDRINQIISNELNKSQSTVLAVCSVIGSKFDMDLLLLVLNDLGEEAKDRLNDIPSTPVALLQCLQGLANELSLLVPLPSPEGRKKGTLFAFRSVDIEHKIYTSLQSDYKRSLHALVAQALEKVHKDDDEALAGHWRIARCYDRSMVYQVKAARRYRRSQNLQQAIAFYRAAISSGSVLQRRKSSSSASPGEPITKIETIYLELAECLLMTEQFNLALETLALAFNKIGWPVPTGHGLFNEIIKIRYWFRFAFLSGKRKESLNRVSPDIVPGTEHFLSSTNLGVVHRTAIHTRLYLAYASGCLGSSMLDEGLDAALRALDLCPLDEDDLLLASVYAVASEFFVWKGWTDIGKALVEHCRPYGVITVHSATIDIVKGKFALAEPKLRSCNLNRMLTENPGLGRRLLLIQAFLAILQEDQMTAKSSLAALERLCSQQKCMEWSRHYATIYHGIIALQRHQLDRCTEILLDSHQTDSELPIAGQAILSLVFLRMGQVSKAAAWFGTLFLEYSAESQVRVWYDLFDHVLVAEYLVQILIDNPARRPKQQLSVMVSPASRRGASDERRYMESSSEEEDVPETKRNLAVVVKKLKEFSSRYPYARGIAELYAGCLELIDTKSDRPDQYCTNILQRAVSILEATDMRFFDARARFIIGSHNGFGDERDHDMLLDARQYFSLSQNQHYLELVDEALQRRPLVDLFAQNRFHQDRVMPDVVIEAMTSAFANRTIYSASPRINATAADGTESQAGSRDGGATSKMSTDPKEKGEM